MVSTDNVVSVESRTQEEDFLRVAANSSAASVAGAISQAIYDAGTVKLRAIGAGAVNQAVKAVAIARGYVATRGLDLSCVPGFEVQQGKDGSDISVMVLRVRVY